MKKIQLEREKMYLLRRFRLRNRFRSRISRRVGCSGRIPRELERIACDVDAAEAPERVGDAPAGIAQEIVRRASRFRAVLNFVRVVQAIVVSIANPSFGDETLIVACEILNIRTSLKLENLKSDSIFI